MKDLTNFSILHDPQMVSLAHIDERRDLYTYYFSVKDGAIELHSIDKWEKAGKSGSSYRHVEVFHFEYKPKIYNEVTGNFEYPIVPESIRKQSEIFRVGYLNSLIL